MFYKLLGVLLLLFSGFFLKSQQAQSYPIKSGTIEYVLTGGFSGTETISFDEYGKLIRIERTISHIVNEEVQVENLILIIKNDSLFEFNAKLKTYTICPISETPYHASNHLITDELLHAMGFYLMGKEMVANNYICDKYTGANGTLWVWKGIVLRSNLTVMGVEVDSKAIKVLSNAQIPISKFNNPNEYHFQLK